MTEIGEIAKRHRLLVIEDGSQAFGATLDGKPCGAFGDLACISLGPMKLLGALGDAGIVLTDSEQVAERLLRLRHSGVVDRDTCVELSHNCRLDTVQAAVLLHRLGGYRTAIARRREIAHRYSRELAGLVATPPVLQGYGDVFYTYTIRTPHRDALRRHLADAGIETQDPPSDPYDRPTRLSGQGARPLAEGCRARRGNPLHPRAREIER